jgi:glutamate synthase (NADPH/NADH) large chain
MESLNEHQGLYRKSFEHDACGIGFVAHVKGENRIRLFQMPLQFSKTLDHRGACGAEPNTGDGAGIMIQVPHEFLFDECLRTGFSCPLMEIMALVSFSLPKEIRAREECREIIYRTAEKLGLEVLGFRKVQIDTTDIGDMALSVEPEIEQVFVARPYHIAEGADFERKLFVLKNLSYQNNL